MNVEPRLLAAFFKRIDQVDACWIWTGVISPRGTERFFLGVNSQGKPSIRSARLWAYKTFVGPLPDRTVLKSTCGHEHCVRPEHQQPVVRKAPGPASGKARKQHVLESDADFLRWAIKTSKRINVTGKHWLWQGGIDPDGYGRIAVPQPGGSYKMVRAHRWFYEFFTDTPLPEGADVVHTDTCAIGLCVNPDHYRVVDHAVHISQCWAEKRESRKKCFNGHLLADVGVDSTGHCRQCNRDKVARHRLRKRLSQA